MFTTGPNGYRATYNPGTIRAETVVETMIRMHAYRDRPKAKRPTRKEVAQHRARLLAW